MKETKDILTPYQCPDCRQEWVEEGYTGHIDCPNCGRPRVEPIIRGSDILFVEDGTFSWDNATGAWIAPHCALPDGFTFGKAIGITSEMFYRAYLCHPIEADGPNGDWVYETIVQGEIERVVFKDGAKGERK